jgi:hypothetical protein
MKRCSKKLHAEIANVRRAAYDTGGVPTLFAKNAENAARAGNCKFARESMERAKRIIKRYRAGR